MPIDPVKIPQNVYVEDRIIGPITLRQIILCLLSGALSYGIFSSIKAAGALSPVTGVLAWTPLVIGAAFAFVKINGISLTRFCLLILERMEKPPRRAFAARRGITISISTGVLKDKDEHAETPKAAPQTSDRKQERIRELSALLDQGPEFASEETAEEAEDVDPLPVDKSRVKAEAMDPRTTVDGIAPQETERRSPSPFRDIAPPSTR